MAIDTLVDNIKALTEEIAEMRTATSRHDTPTPIPFLPTKEVQISPTASQQQPTPKPSPPKPQPSWATVAKKRNKKTRTDPTRPTQTTAKPKSHNEARSSIKQPYRKRTTPLH